MNASWPMVIGALLAGTVGGFMIPVRPEIRDVPALTASRTTEPAAKNGVATPAKTEGSADVRKISLTEQNAENTRPATEPKTPAAQAESTPCERQAWPNQTPNCLDRSAKVTPAETVPARRIDPATSIADQSEPKAETKSVAAPEPAAAAPKQEATAASKPEPVMPRPKAVSIPPTREERAERPARMDEPRAQTTVDRDGQVTERPRRSSRRVNRDDLDDGIPTKIYLRGPDGRLYLAPEYRPSGRAVYIMR